MDGGSTLNEMRATLLFERGVPPEYANAIESWALRGRFSERPRRPTLLGLIVYLAVFAIVAMTIWWLNSFRASRHANSRKKPAQA